MRKFDVRWWDGPDLQEWRFMVAADNCCSLFAFWPHITQDIRLPTGGYTFRPLDPDCRHSPSGLRVWASMEW